jgi:hypothetical protein
MGIFDTLFGKKTAPSESQDNVNNIINDLKKEKINTLLTTNPTTIIKILDNHNNREWKEKWFVSNAIPYLLIYENVQVQSKAAEFAWNNDDATIDAYVNVLGSKGLIASGISLDKALIGMRALYRKCPSERRQHLEQQILEKFGPSFLKEIKSE